MVRVEILCDVDKAIGFIPKAKSMWRNMKDGKARLHTGEVLVELYKNGDNGYIRFYPQEDPKLLAVHPKTLNSGNYPFNTDARGVVYENMTYDQPESIEAGNCYWHGADTVLSWKGSPGFNLALDTETNLSQIGTEDTQNPGINLYYTAFGPFVYENEEIVWGETDSGKLVLGACYYNGVLIVMVREYEAGFKLRVYSGYTLIAEQLVGRFNNIFSFKSDGSAGISMDGGIIYRFDSATATFTTETASTNSTIAISGTNTSDTSTVKTPAGEYTGYHLPVTVASLDPTARAAWDIAASQVETTTTTNVAQLSGSGELVFGYGYDENDNEVPLIFEVELNLDHNYELVTENTNDAMLVMPEGSTGVTVNNDCGNPESAPCGGTFTNCSGGTYTIDPPSATLSITASSNPIQANGTLTVSGGVGPYTWHVHNASGVDTGSVSGANNQIWTRSACTPGSVGLITVIKVEDACGNKLENLAYKLAGSWVEDVSGPVGSCPINCSWTSSELTDNSQYRWVGSGCDFIVNTDRITDNGITNRVNACSTGTIITVCLIVVGYYNCNTLCGLTSPCWSAFQALVAKGFIANSAGRGTVGTCSTCTSPFYYIPTSITYYVHTSYTWRC